MIALRKGDGGNLLYSDAKRTMRDILHSVRRVTDLMSEISAATVAQSGGIDQINRRQPRSKALHARTLA